METTDALFQKAQTFLRSAAVLLELEDFDSCASRAYFAMFYAAQAALIRANAPNYGRTGVRSAFENVFVEGGYLPDRASTALHKAAELQEVADYAHHYAVDQENAEWVLAEAEAFVNSVAQLDLSAA